MSAAKVRLAGIERAFDAREGEDLLEVLQSNGTPIETSCGGVGACGLCRITVEAGRRFLSPFRPVEEDHLGREAEILGTRLACQSKIRIADSSGPVELVIRVDGSPA
jgi:Na+-transporting NADH:ubiquinone oxidoreductase subunit F